jgi:uncharacterized protein involved in exopolysaccharide biosynthesis
MNALVVILRFLYRTRYWILIGPLLVTGIVYYFTRGLPTTFEANTTIFTGITSTPDISSETVSKNNPNNAYDNIIYLVHSSTIVEKVSLRLLARVLVNGSAEKDNKYINAENFAKITNLLPDEVKKLIVKGNEIATFNNLQKYKKEDKDNFIYGLLNWSHPYFSVSALNKIEVRRLGNSDMIELKYKNDDPGIVYQTLNIVNEELIHEYSFYQLGSSNSVIEYFQTQLDSIRSLLRVQEDSLVLFSKEQNIVDYSLQTQMMVQRLENYETQYAESSMDASTSQDIIDNLEKRLSKRAELMKNNQAFLQALGTVSLFSKKISSIVLESGGSGEDSGEGVDADKLPVYRQALQKSERQLYTLADNINETLYTTDGAVINDLVKEWLSETLKKEKAKAEMVILEQKKKSLENDYFKYAPVGPELKRQEREITLTEETYHSLINRLSEAKMQQKNFEMKSAQLNIVTLPVYPLSFIESKRRSLVLFAFAGSLIFILGCFLLMEMLDRTIRDKYRTFALTKESALGAYPGPLLLKYRSHAKEIDRIVSSYIANRLMYLMEPGKMNLINLISKESGEGRSSVAESLATHWKAQGFDVRVVSHHTDYDANQKEYYQASSVEHLVRLGNSKPDIVLMEHAPLEKNSINKNFLKQAVANIYLIRATRAWSEVDGLMFRDVSNLGQNVFILLTHAKLFAVEDFTGLLPPVSKIRKWANRLLKLELTSEKEKSREQ